MNQINNELHPELSDLLTRINMKDSLGYIKILLNDILEFEESLKKPDSSLEQKRNLFMRLITLSLGSTTNWKRADTLSRLTGISMGAIRRYVQRVSAPHEIVFPIITKCLKEILETEYSEIEASFYQLEKAAEAKQAAKEKEWRELVERVANPLPGMPLNCQVRYVPENNQTDYQTSLLFCYPCLGIYNLGMLFTSVCPECSKNGKEQAPTHGRVILSGEDGLLLLPHIVHTQADLVQVIQDLHDNQQAGGSLVLDNASWFDECSRVLTGSSIVQSLPEGNMIESKPRDLSQDKLCWVM